MNNIKTFEEYSGKIYNPENHDKRTDGPSASELPRLYHINVNTPPKIKRGNNARKKQELREKDRKEKAREFKIAKLQDFQTDDDIIKSGVPLRQPTTNAGGATSI